LSKLLSSLLKNGYCYALTNVNFGFRHAKKLENIHEQ